MKTAIRPVAETATQRLANKGHTSNSFTSKHKGMWPMMIMMMMMMMMMMGMGMGMGMGYPPEIITFPLFFQSLHPIGGSIGQNSWDTTIVVYIM